MKQMNSTLFHGAAGSDVDSSGRLFTHFCVAHGHLFACSNPPPTYSGADLNIANVHKFTILSQTGIAYFISQLRDVWVLEMSSESFS